MPRASKEPVVNLSGKLLDHAMYSALCKCLNYGVAPAVLPIEDILSGVQKAVKSLPVYVSEEARQETVRILRDFSGPRVNLTH